MTVLDLPLAVLTSGVVATADALTGLVVAFVGATVTLAAATVRETPESQLTLIALSTVDVGEAQTLTGGDVTEVVSRPDRVTVALCKVTIDDIYLKSVFVNIENISTIAIYLTFNK